MAKKIYSGIKPGSKNHAYYAFVLVLVVSTSWQLSVHPKQLGSSFPSQVYPQTQLKQQRRVYGMFSCLEFQPKNKKQQQINNKYVTRKSQICNQVYRQNSIVDQKQFSRFCMFYSFFPGPINKRSKALSSDIFTLFPSFLLLGRNNSRRFGKARLLV